MKISRIFLVIIISAVLCFQVYSSFETLKTFRGMLPLQAENNYNKFFLTTSDLSSLYTSWPNLTATTIPIDALKARYYLIEGKNEKALKLLWSSRSHNPYLRFNEALLSTYYLAQKNTDSAYYYANIAYSNLPKNPLHAQVMIHALAFKGDTIEMTKTFNQITKYYPNNLKLWKLYLVNQVLLSKGNNDNIIEYLNKAVKKYPSNIDLKNLRKQYLIGDSLVLEAEKLAILAKEKQKLRKYLEAAQFFHKAYKLDTLEYTYLESSSGMYYLSKKHRKSIDLAKKVIKDFETKDGKSEYIIARNFVELDSIKTACDYIINSKLKGYSNSNKLFEKYCKKAN